MQIFKAFKFELIPNSEQIRKMKQFCGCSRFVFNRALAWQNEQYDADETFKFSYAQVANFLPEWKRELVWLKECHSQVLQQSLKDLESAFKNFFTQRANFPRFKRKGEKDSFRFPQSCKLEQHNSRLYLPKIGWVRYRNSRHVSGSIKNVTISRQCGKWYASIQTECEQEIPQPKGGEVGISMGIARFATLSTGQSFEPLHSVKALKGKLGKLKKQLKRKTKFSQNWQKLKAKINKLHYKITNICQNYLHQISSAISKNHAIVYVEEAGNRAKSAKNNVKQHGNNRKQKARLDHSSLNQSWIDFQRQLSYKLLWHGGHLITVSHPALCCPACKHTAQENTQTKFKCTQCGFTENTDIVSAISILKRGQAILAAQ